MGIRVPRAADKRDMGWAGVNGNGKFIITSEEAHTVEVPDEWRVPLAAHLLAGTTWLDSESFKALREIEQKIRKKRKLGAEDADRIASLANSLECLMYEFLQAQPSTSTRYEYRPSYYDDTVKRLVESRVGDIKQGLDWYGIIQREREAALAAVPKEALDETPMPWE